MIGTMDIDIDIDIDAGVRVDDVSISSLDQHR